MKKQRLAPIVLSALAMSAMVPGAATVAGAAAPRDGIVYGKPASIAFASSGGIRDWHAEDDRSLYIRDRTGRWYLATLSGPCRGLKFDQTVGFETDFLGRFDDWGVVVTRDMRCHVESLVTSPAPAAKGGPKAAKAEKAA